VNIVIRKTRAAAIKLEVGNLAKALERYKLEYGEFPPDFALVEGYAAKADTINKHLMRKFRYRNPDLDLPADPALDVAPVEYLGRLDPMEALYFWLKGFSPDHTRPVFGPGDRTPLFEFDQSRLTDRDQDGFPEYVPPRGSNIPYIYYQNNNYVEATAWATASTSPALMIPKPYLAEVSEVAVRARASTGDQTAIDIIPFAEPERFQIISAGLDGEFGEGGGLYPSGQGYTTSDRDNITSFTQGSTLEDDVP
jgi:hypothetical protein